MNHYAAAEVSTNKISDMICKKVMIHDANEMVQAVKNCCRENKMVMIYIRNTAEIHFLQETRVDYPPSSGFVLHCLDLINQNGRAGNFLIVDVDRNQYAALWVEKTNETL